MVAYETSADFLAAGEQVELLAGFNAVSPAYLQHYGMTWALRTTGASGPRDADDGIFPDDDLADDDGPSGVSDKGGASAVVSRHAEGPAGRW